MTIGGSFSGVVASKVGYERAWLVFDGDSLTWMGAYPSECAAMVGKPYVNLAISGQTTYHILSNTNTDLYGGLPANDTYILWIGTNDLYAHTAPATIYANIVAIVAARAAANFTPIFVCTLQDERDGEHYADRSTLNALIIAGAAANGYTVADLAADARIGPEHASADPTYFIADMIHMTPAGLLIAADIVAAAILA